MSNMNDIERLKLLTREKTDLERKIEMLSIYESDVIGDIIAKLMTSYEGVLYKCKKNDYMFGRFDYSVDISENNFINPPIYRLGFLSKMKFRDLVSNYKEKKMSFLPPSGYLSVVGNIYTDILDPNRVDYVQRFIDYSYEIRDRESLFDITKERLEGILSEFLENTKEEQQVRKEEIAKKIAEKNERDKRHAFEKLCMIDRTSIFNAISYIINNYEDNMTVVQQKYPEWNRTGQWSTLTGYHEISVKSDFGKRSFTVEVDSDECFPDDEKWAKVNYDKKTSINYFDFKNTLFPVLKNSPYCIILMGLIEGRYNDTKLLTSTDVEELLGTVSDGKKTKIKKI